VVQLHLGVDRDRTCRASAGARRQGQYLWGTRTGTSALPAAAAVPASVTVYRKAASSLMDQPYARGNARRPPAQTVTEARVYEQRQNCVLIATTTMSSRDGAVEVSGQRYR
jgi:hypothetical protein